MPKSQEENNGIFRQDKEHPEDTPAIANSSHQRRRKKNDRNSGDWRGIHRSECHQVRSALQPGKPFSGDRNLQRQSEKDTTAVIQQKGNYDNQIMRNIIYILREKHRPISFKDIVREIHSEGSEHKHISNLLRRLKNIGFIKFNKETKKWRAV